MANRELLTILRQGANVWNKWRAENPAKSYDLTQADLGQINLIDVDLDNVNLNGAFLSSAILTNAKLNNAVLIGADLRGAILNNTKLIGTSFRRANLRNVWFDNADFSGADLVDANFQESNLENANLSNATLIRANFTEVNLDDSNFEYAELGETIFGNVNLSKIKNLEKARHRLFSILSHNTIQRSKGKIPEVFMRGCGLSDWEIESVKLYHPNLDNDEINKILYKMYDIRAQQPIQVSPLFISYSHADSAFVDRLEGHLNERGVRFWRDIHHTTAGRLEKQIDRAIRQNPTVLLVLSENSLKSDWVQHEVRMARELEKKIDNDVLCPVALDESWKLSSWPERLIEQIKEYNILDFSAWNDESKFNTVFDKLITGLNLYYQK